MWKYDKRWLWKDSENWPAETNSNNKIEHSMCKNSLNKTGVGQGEGINREEKEGICNTFNNKDK